MRAFIRGFVSNQVTSSMLGRQQMTSSDFLCIYCLCLRTPVGADGTQTPSEFVAVLFLEVSIGASVEKRAGCF